ncbi:MAG TPA: beta-ketoacyl synthase N-terminal-like domain-containing protein [Candidatus Acidoferrales bacterium]|nr:beta-ketoacyl synthase N-terminal-like domain-containing protein [Candidatus Acidoferrales bacterium]
MTTKTQFEDLSPIKKALYEIRTLKGKLQHLTEAQNEPVAIVGVGLRFPGGASDATSYWKILTDRVNTVTEIPAARWNIDDYFDANPEAPGKMYSRHGSFLADTAGFDAHLFGVSPREAIEMDPQHRIALEVAWEALENAGCSPAQAAKSKAGVFLALSNSDYLRLVFNDRIDELDAYSSTGNNFSVAAGRISYTLGLDGPSMVVDTACSGSLVAVHLACQSLRLRDCDMALAGGVNLILSPEINVNFCKSHMLAADGFCKTFDSKADGFVRGEGCGIIVLKRLSDALAGGDNILALIRGSAVNQDGRSGGLTVPNGNAQQKVIRQALANAGVEPHEIGYVEAHGTGTSLGDPIEAHALAAVLGPQRTRENPLVIGSVKTNIGHLEAAAGVAGLIKVALSLHNEQIPANLHFQSMNPHIDWAGVPVEVPIEARPWRRANGRRVAGVSSFGFSGTNAHIILEEAPVRETRDRNVAERPIQLLAISARSKQALQQLTERYVNEMSRTNADLGDICYTANSGRAHFDERAVYLGATRDEMHQALLGKPAASGSKNGDQEVAFLFPGQGAQYAGMGKDLYAAEPIFRKTLDQCAELLKDQLEEPLLEVLWGGKTDLLNQTAYSQPALFAVEYSIAEMWKSWGIEPSIVLGHSVGEYVAACVAGIYSLANGLKLIVGRARLMQAVSGMGAMCAAMTDENKVKVALAGLESRISIAALNAPENTVLSGYESDLQIAEDRLRQAGVRVQRLAVSHAFHSPQMEEMETAFEQLASDVQFNSPRIRLVSSVTGQLIGPKEMADAGYWRRQVRQPVLFRKAVETLGHLGAEIFLEVGAGATLVGLGQQTLSGKDRIWLTSLRKGRAEWTSVLDSLAQLYARGVEVNWAGFDEPYVHMRVPLPTYPFERQNYWLDLKVAATPRSIDADWSDIAAAASRQSGQCSLALNLGSYPQRWALVDKLTTEYILSAFASCNAFQKVGEAHTVDSLVRLCGFKTTYGKLLQRWMKRLVREGELKQDGEVFTAPQPLRSGGLQELRATTEKAFLDDRIIFDYIVSCGEDLVAILQGRKSSLETLFPNGDFTRAENLYERAPLSVYFNSIARAALEGFLRGRKPGALRILEIGAGTGSTSSFLLPVMPRENAIYDFTDVSEIFVNNAERKFAAFRNVRYGLFDIERDGVAQGYPAGNFDVVVATNALHATRDIRATIANVRSMLAPGGILILCEVTDYLSWYDITTGLIEGWQLFEDGLRDDHPLLETKVWTKCLEEGGFTRVMAFPENGSPAEILGQHVIVAGTSSVGADRRVAIPSSMLAARPVPQSAAVPDQEEIDLAAWIEAPAADRHEHFVKLVQQQIADLLRLDSTDRVKAKSKLIDLGLDSLMAIELRNRMVRLLHLQKPLSSTLVFDYPTPDAMALHLENQVLGLGEDFPAERDGDAATRERANELAELDDEDVQEMLLKKLQTL